MPCERPGITPIDDSCCFSCYTEGRGTYPNPIAIVLHEVDYHLEALNNKLENCCHDDHEDCHQSFHYGVGGDGRIINWVDPANTAWSFDPINSDTKCGICGWSIATQQGANVNPNLYTINIAVSTGIVAYDQSSPNRLAENNYTEDQYDSIVRLVGWLSDEYNITINQNTIWRHCNELDDFPAGCCCADCGPCETYSDFLQAVQDCVDSTSGVLPWLCDAMCDGELLPGEPMFVFGADAECNVCGKYQIGPTTQENFCDLMAAVIQPENLTVPPGTELVAPDCASWLMPNLCELMGSTSIGVGATIVDDTITVLGSDCEFHAIDQLANFDLCARIAAAYTTDGGEAVPGQTNLLGLDCSYYQIPDVPDFCSMLFAATDVYDETLNWVLLQRNDAGDACRAVLIDDGCGEDGYIHAALGVGETGPLIGKVRPSLPNRTVAISTIFAPETDGVMYVDATNGNVVITLTPPEDCEPNVFYIKRTDITGSNTVTIAGGGYTIDGAANITLGTPGPFSANSGMSVMIYWNGTNWSAH